MNFIQTEIPDVIIIEPNVYIDPRGYFLESFRKDKFVAAGINAEFLQDNQSFSKFGVLRGLHYQKAPFAQAKLVRVLSGRILDVAVDMRKGSPYFGKHVAVELSAENKKQLYIPRGFAHGFVILSETAEFFYKCDNLYHPEADRGIAFDDPALGIDWGIDKNSIILSDKDKKHPALAAADNNFVY